jgi:hypothetical protein
MSRSIARARAGRERTSLYQEITDKIITELKTGRVPWVQPWGTVAAKASLTMPKNAATHRHYSGINVLILWGAVIDRGFSTQNWLTFRQALRLGGSVRKGEHGTTVLYADHFVPDEERRRAVCDGGEPVVAQAETLIAATGADFRIDRRRALKEPPSANRRRGRPRFEGGHCRRDGAHAARNRSAQPVTETQRCTYPTLRLQETAPVTISLGFSAARARRTAWIKPSFSPHAMR